MAFREDTGEVVGVAPRREQPELPAITTARSHTDLADAIQRPGDVDAEAVRKAADKTAGELSHGLNQVDVNAMVIADIMRAERLKQQV